MWLFYSPPSPVNILYNSIAGRYRSISVADGSRTARYRFIKNTSWESILGTQYKISRRQITLSKIVYKSRRQKYSELKQFYKHFAFDVYFIGVYFIIAGSQYWKFSLKTPVIHWSCSMYLPLSVSGPIQQTTNGNIFSYFTQKTSNRIGHCMQIVSIREKSARNVK